MLLKFVKCRFVGVYYLHNFPDDIWAHAKLWRNFLTRFHVNAHLQLLSRRWEEVVFEINSEPRMLQDILKWVNTGLTHFHTFIVARSIEFVFSICAIKLSTGEFLMFAGVS